MKNFNFLIFLSFLCSLSVLKVEEIYIIENKKINCAKSNCSGNMSNPYNSIVNGWFFPFQKKIKNRELNILLGSDKFSILPTDLEFMNQAIQLMKSLSNLNENVNVTVLPKKCLSFLKIKTTCPFYSNIYVKAEKFSIAVPDNLRMINLNFFGNDISLNFNETENNDCYNNSENCCEEVSFKNKKLKNNCFIDKKVIENSKISDYGLFTFKSSKLNSSSKKNLILENCNFENFHSIKRSDFFFASLIYLNGIPSNYSKQIILLKNCSIRNMYFQNGIIFSNLTNTVINLEKTNISRYNDFEINESNFRKKSPFNLCRTTLFARECHFNENYALQGENFYFSFLNNATFEKCSFLLKSMRQEANSSFYLHKKNYIHIYNCRILDSENLKSLLNGNVFFVKILNTLQFSLNIFKLMQRKIQILVYFRNEVNLIKNTITVMRITLENKYYFIKFSSFNKIIISKFIAKYFDFLFDINQSYLIIMNFIFVHEGNSIVDIFTNSSGSFEKIFAKKLKLGIFVFALSSFKGSFIFATEIGNPKKFVDRSTFQIKKGSSLSLSNLLIATVNFYKGTLFKIDYNDGKIFEASNLIANDLKTSDGGLLNFYYNCKVSLNDIFATNIKVIETGALLFYFENYIIIKNLRFSNIQARDGAICLSNKGNFLKMSNFCIKKIIVGDYTIFLIDKGPNKVIIRNSYFNNISNLRKISVLLINNIIFELSNSYFKNINNKAGGLITCVLKNITVIILKSYFINIQSVDETLLLIFSENIRTYISKLMMKNIEGPLFKIPKNCLIHLNHSFVINLKKLKEFTFGRFIDSIEVIIKFCKMKFVEGKQNFIICNKNISFFFLNSIIEEINLERGGVALIENKINFTLINFLAFKIKVNFGGILYISGDRSKIYANRIISENFVVKEFGGLFYLLNNLHKLVIENVFALKIYVSLGKGISIYSEKNNEISMKNCKFSNVSSLKKAGFIVLISNNILVLRNLIIYHLNSSEEGGFLYIENFNTIRIESMYLEDLKSQFSGLGYAKNNNSLNGLKIFLKFLISEGIDAFHLLEYNKFNLTSMNIKYTLSNFPCIFLVGLLNEFKIFSLKIIDDIPRKINKTVYLKDSKCSSLPALSELKSSGFLLTILQSNIIELKNLSVIVTIHCQESNKDLNFFKEIKSENLFSLNKINNTFIFQNSIILILLPNLSPCKYVNSQNFKLLASFEANLIFWNHNVIDFSKIYVNSIIKMTNTTFISKNLDIFLIQNNFLEAMVNSRINFLNVKIHKFKSQLLDSKEFILINSSLLTLKNFKIIKISNFNSSFILSSNSNIIIKNSQISGFSNNFKNGSLIFGKNSSLEIFKTLIFLNKNYESGGAIYIKGSKRNKVTIEKSLFFFNSARKKGGCLYLENVQLILLKNKFHGNKGVKGGVIYLYNIKMGVISNNYLLNNRAKHFELVNEFINSQSGRGGVFYIDSEKHISISNLKLTNNSFFYNSAEIGSISYIESKIHYYNNQHKKNFKNEALFFGEKFLSRNLNFKLGFLVKQKNFVLKRYKIKIILNDKNFFEKCVLQFIPLNKFSFIDTSEIQKIYNSLTIVEENKNTNDMIFQQLSANVSFYSFKKFLFKFSLQNEIICLKGNVYLIELPFINSGKYTIIIKNKNENFFNFELINKPCYYGTNIKKVNISHFTTYKCIECERGNY